MMTVAACQSCGAVLDHSSSRIFLTNTEDEHAQKKSSYKMKKELFEVYTPFYMDSQAQRILLESQGYLTSSGSEIKETSAQRKRRKRKAPTLKEEEQRVAVLLERVLPNLLTSAKKCNTFLQDQNDFLQLSDNNKNYRLFATANIGCGDMFQNMCNRLATDTYIADNRKLVLNKDCLKVNHDCSSFINMFVENPEDVGVLVHIDNLHFLIPPQSKFLMSTFALLANGLYKSLAVPEGYDLIILDPPWYNKSVKRKKGYKMFDESELCSFQLSCLCKPGTVVCVWVTNNERILSFVKDVLFSAWNIQWTADWIWLKVTQYGETVCDIRSSQKKPYERLVIGVVNNNSCQNTNPASSSTTSPSLSKQCDTKQNLQQQPEDRMNEDKITQNIECSDNRFDNLRKSCFPKDYVIVSVPCSLHSKKPYLSEVLAPFLPSRPKCLELFARNLQPGWTSWGNEVLRHQHMDYFER